MGGGGALHPYHQVIRGTNGKPVPIAGKKRYLRLKRGSATGHASFVISGWHGPDGPAAGPDGCRTVHSHTPTHPHFTGTGGLILHRCHCPCLYGNDILNHYRHFHLRHSRGSSGCSVAGSAGSGRIRSLCTSSEPLAEQHCLLRAQPRAVFCVYCPPQLWLADPLYGSSFTITGRSLFL